MGLELAVVMNGGFLRAVTEIAAGFLDGRLG